MKTRIIFILMLTLAGVNTQGQWQQLHPRPTGMAYLTVCALEGNKIITGAGPGIYLGEMHGSVWSKTLNTSYEIFDMSFANSLNGIAAGAESRVFYTSDGGTQWNEVLLNGYSDVKGVFLLSSGIGFAVSENGLYKTADFGQNWASMETSISEYELYKVFALDENHIYAVGDQDVVFLTSDGGETWNSYTFSQMNRISCVYFVDEEIGFVGDDKGYLMRTNDGGLSWEEVFYEVWNSIYSIRFVTPEIGIATSIDQILKTTDGGQSWEVITFPESDSFYSVAWAGENTVYIAGTMGVFRSFDAGLNWENLNKSATRNGFTTAAFYSENTILAFSNSSSVIRSEDNGYSWEELPPPSTGYYPYRNACEVNNEEIFVITLSGKILKTIDGGDNWEIFDPGIVAQGIDIIFQDSQTGFISLADGNIYRTTDGGQNWSSVYSGTYNIMKIRFFDPQFGMAVGDAGIILRTTNGGLTWSEIANSNTNLYNDLTFINQDTIFSIGKWGRIYRSTDSGLSWLQIPTGNNNELVSIVFLDQNTGYITTSVFGTTLKTTDGGETWAYDTYLGYNYSKAMLTPNGSILVVGGYGHISILPVEGSWNTPSSPIALAAQSITTTGFTAHWDASEGAKSYLLFVSNDGFNSCIEGYHPYETQTTDATIASLEPNKSYSYKVIASNEAGNSAFSNTIEVVTPPLGIMLEKTSNIKVYPNPAKDFFNIDIPVNTKEAYTITILNHCGQELRIMEHQQGTRKVDIRNWPTGIYLLKLCGQKKTITKKIVVQ